MHSGGNGCGDSGNANFTDSFAAEWVHVRVFLLNADSINVLNVCIYGNMILTQVAVHVVAVANVQMRFFMQCLTDTPNDAPRELRSRRLGVKNANTSRIRLHAVVEAALSDATGLKISLFDIPPDTMLDTLLSVHFPTWQAEGLIEDYAHYQRGEASAIACARCNR